MMPIMVPTLRVQVFSCPESRRKRERGNGVRVHWREYPEESYRERSWLGGRKCSEIGMQLYVLSSQCPPDSPTARACIVSLFIKFETLDLL